MNLNSIAKVENEFGSIYKIAEDLVDDRLPDSIVGEILKSLKVYDALPDEIEAPKLRLKNILLDILEPLDEMGAFTLGEEIEQ